MDGIDGDAQLDKVWEGDLFSRRQDAAFLQRFLVARSGELTEIDLPKSFVINLDAEWGEGKSFFLARFRRQLEVAGFGTAYVDAWSNDFAEDPLTVVMAAIDKQVEQTVGRESKPGQAWSKVLKVGGKIAGQIAKGAMIRIASAAVTTGVAAAVAETISDSIDPQKAGDEAASIAVGAIDKVLDSRAEEAVSEFRATQASIETFKIRLREFVSSLASEAEKGPPFFIIIDELDRCRPLFAIAMLERVKHLFNLPSVVFIVATATSQLAHSVKAVYGADFEAIRYLNRFFDSTYLFEKPDKLQFVNSLLERYPLGRKTVDVPMKMPPAQFLAEYFFHSGFTARSIEQIYDMLRTIISAWNDIPPPNIGLLLPLIAEFHAQPGKFDVEYDWKTWVIGRRLPSKWGVGFYARDSQGHPRQQIQPMQTILQDLWNAGHGDVAQYTQNSRPNTNWDIWIAEVMSKEYELRYNGKAPIPGYPSVIRSYPAIVKRAGRIVDQVFVGT